MDHEEGRIERRPFVIPYNRRTIRALSGGALKLYLNLLDLAAPHDFLTNHSRAMLADCMGLEATRSVDKYIRELEEMGIINVTREVLEDNSRAVNTYHLSGKLLA